MNHWINKFLQFSFIYLVPIHDTNHLKALYNWKNTLHLCGENPNNQTTPYEKELGHSGKKKNLPLNRKKPQGSYLSLEGVKEDGQFVLICKCCIFLFFIDFQSSFYHYLIMSLRVGGSHMDHFLWKIHHMTCETLHLDLIVLISHWLSTC